LRKKKTERSEDMPRQFCRHCHHPEDSGTSAQGRPELRSSLG
jgi:cytochrome c553